MNAFIGTLDKDSKEDFFQFTASACYIYCSIYDVDCYPYKIEDDFFYQVMLATVFQKNILMV